MRDKETASQMEASVKGGKKAPTFLFFVYPAKAKGHTPPFVLLSVLLLFISVFFSLSLFIENMLRE